LANFKEGCYFELVAGPIQSERNSDEGKQILGPPAGARHIYDSKIFRRAWLLHLVEAQAVERSGSKQPNQNDSSRFPLSFLTSVASEEFLWQSTKKRSGGKISLFE